MVDEVPEIDPALGLDGATEALYALRPEEFIPARDAAVKRARADGDRDLAAALASLRKPTASASASAAVSVRSSSCTTGSPTR